MVEQMKSYQKRCMKSADHGISRSIISVTSYAIEKTFKIYCLNRKRRVQYYEAGVCANQNKKGTIKCTNDMIETLLRGKTVDPKDKFPIMCW